MTVNKDWLTGSYDVDIFDIKHKQIISCIYEALKH